MNPHPIQEARRRSRSHTPTSEAGMCLREVRECFGVGPTSPPTDDAAEAWQRAEHKHAETDPRKIPRGVPVFWTGGSHGHGHIAISTGYGGKCFSTDIVREGYFDQVPITEIHDRWGLTLVGWSEDLNGVRVYDPKVHSITPHPAPDAAPAKKTPAAKKTAAKKRS